MATFGELERSARLAARAMAMAGYEETVFGWLGGPLFRRVLPVLLLFYFMPGFGLKPGVKNKSLHLGTFATNFREHREQHSHTWCLEIPTEVFLSEVGHV
jgi:hypothetical protein